MHLFGNIQQRKDNWRNGKENIAIYRKKIEKVGTVKTYRTEESQYSNFPLCD